jgi:hypothetical protein
MKYLFLLLVSQITFSQIQGKVVDASGIPVPYVNIWVENENIGGTSELDGTFKIQSTLDKTLVFSAVGFETLKSKIKENANVVLKTVTYQLDEVVISKPKKTIEVEIGEAKKLHHSQLSGGEPWIYARYFNKKSEYFKTPFIKEVIVFSNSNVKNSKFKLRIFTVGKDGFPDADLLNEDIVVIAKSGFRMNTIDISKFNLSMPDEGIFIAYEWMIIEENKYLFEYKEDFKMHSFTTYSPSLVLNNFVEANSYKYRNGKWYKDQSYFDKDSQKNVFTTPAINLTLTN